MEESIYSYVQVFFFLFSALFSISLALLGFHPYLIHYKPFHDKSCICAQTLPGGTVTFILCCIKLFTNISNDSKNRMSRRKNVKKSNENSLKILANEQGIDIWQNLKKIYHKQNFDVLSGILTPVVHDNKPLSKEMWESWKAINEFIIIRPPSYGCIPWNFLWFDISVKHFKHERYECCIGTYDAYMN